MICCALIVSLVIALVFACPVYSQQIPSEAKPDNGKATVKDADNLSVASKLINDYFKAKGLDERGKILDALEKTGFMPSVKELSRIIKETAVYPSMEPLKRTTRKIMVSGKEYSYELSLPKGYTPKKEEPLIIALHGSGGNGLNALHIWRISEEDQDAEKEKMIDLIKRQGQKPPPKGSMRVRSTLETGQYIIAAPTLENAPGKGVSADLMEHLLPVLLEDVASVCNIDTNRVVITGFSMGGHFTWAETLHQPDCFAGAVPMMGACDDMGALSNLRSVPVYAIHGDKDNIVPVEFSRNATAALTALKFDVTYREIKGLGHTLFPWDSPECAKLLEWIGSRTRDPYPKKISYRFSGQSAAVKKIYWLEVVQGQKNAFTVEAEVVDNVVNIKSTGVTKATLLLNSELVDFAKDVIVRVNGRKVFNGRADPSYKFLLENFQEYSDPKSLFTAGITLDMR
ncbi:MAG: dienelactone hydrolase family protein [Thermoleophilia bacterium]